MGKEHRAMGSGGKDLQRNRGIGAYPKKPGRSWEVTIAVFARCTMKSVLQSVQELNQLRLPQEALTAQLVGTSGSPVLDLLIHRRSQAWLHPA